MEPILEEYPANFNLDEFKAIKSFSGKLKYASDKLERVGSGSSRTVFKIDDKKVLKIAKNAKGVAQNGLEASLGRDYYLRGLVADVYDSDDNDLWIEMELAQKAKPTTFKNITGVDIKELDQYLKYVYNQNNPRRGGFGSSISDELKNKMDENEFAQSIQDLMLNYDMPAGDLGRLSSYGVINRGGKDEVVLIDYGLNFDVGQEYYKLVREEDNSNLEESKIRKVVRNIINNLI